MNATATTAAQLADTLRGLRRQALMFGPTASWSALVGTTLYQVQATNVDDLQEWDTILTADGERLVIEQDGVERYADTTAVWARYATASGQEHAQLLTYPMSATVVTLKAFVNYTADADLPVVMDDTADAEWEDSLAGTWS